MMRNLPVPVSEEDIDAMFDFADKDKDGKINYRSVTFDNKSVTRNKIFVSTYFIYFQ